LLAAVVAQPELPIQCTPAAARKTVKASATRIPQLERQQHLVPLLAYCLSDLDLSAGPTGSWLQQLVGLRLLPLADGQGLAEVEVTTGTAVPRQLVFVVTEPLELMLVKSQSEH
jgi:hypothetical protein